METKEETGMAIKIVNGVKSLDIRYGELDRYYPLKFDSKVPFDKMIKKIEKNYSSFIQKTLGKERKDQGDVFLEETMESCLGRSEFIKEENKKILEFMGAPFTNFQERLVLLPLKIELTSEECVWLHAVLYLFKNNMGILKLELPIVNVNNIPLKQNDWDAYISKVSCAWCDIESIVSTLEEIKKLYLSVILQTMRVQFISYGEWLSHIIMVDFDGCPHGVQNITDEIQEELFRIISAPVVEAPYTTYVDEAKEYLSKNTWGTHNVRCIINPTGACLSIVDKNVQEYWIEQYKMNPNEIPADVYIQYVREVQYGTEYPFVMILLKRINVLEDISKKNALGHGKRTKVKRRYKQIMYEYLKNTIDICNIQEGCCGTVSKQFAEFERLMPYYTYEEISKCKQRAYNEILQGKASDREEKYQDFISIGGLGLSLVFGLPAIHETIDLLRNVVLCGMADIPYISLNNVSVAIWLIINIYIGIRIIRLRQ